MAKKTRIGKIHKVVNKERKKFSNENAFYFAVILKEEDNQATQFLFTEGELERAAHRAARNQEDALEQSGISKLID
jgi:hypothetical protein